MYQYAQELVERLEKKFDRLFIKMKNFDFAYCDISNNFSAEISIFLPLPLFCRIGRSKSDRNIRQCFKRFVPFIQHEFGTTLSIVPEEVLDIHKYDVQQLGI
ncbi:hypothetical protein, partial [Bacillus cereus group sp. N6]|uniref:hypothetical protein n=1 Tax=Bacillus cereus group sp. N6 TaxID=2794583 RepID=UPI001A7EB58A